MLGQVVDTVVRFFSKLHCNIKCCSNTVRVSSPPRRCRPGSSDGGNGETSSPCLRRSPKRRPYKPRSPVRRQRTI